MIRVEVIEQFTLKDFYKLNNIKRKSIDVKGTLFIGDTFECDEDMVKYLTGNNEQGKVVVKVIEVVPEIIKTNDEIKVKKDNVEVIINKNEIVKEIKKQSKNKKSNKK